MFANLHTRIRSCFGSRQPFPPPPPCPPRAPRRNNEDIILAQNREILHGNRPSKSNLRLRRDHGRTRNNFESDVSPFRYVFLSACKSFYLFVYIRIHISVYICSSRQRYICSYISVYICICISVYICSSRQQHFRATGSLHPGMI